MSDPQNPSQELAVKQERVPIQMGAKGIEIRSFDELARFCTAVSRSGLAPKGLQTPEAIMVAVQAGMEVGLSPFQALQGMAVINGRPSLYGDAALAVVSGHPDFEDIEETIEGTGEKMVASCVIRRKGRLPIKRVFSVPDAKLAKLWGKVGPWTEYPNRMMQMRARSWAMRDSFADALKGVGVVEEQNDTPARIEKKANAIVLPGDPTPEEQPKLQPVSSEPKPLTPEDIERIEREEALEAARLQEYK